MKRKIRTLRLKELWADKIVISELTITSDAAVLKSSDVSGSLERPHEPV